MENDQILDRKTVPADTLIFREGTPGNRAYLIQAGQVEIWKEIDGKRKRLGVAGKGSLFGEMALIDDSPRMANATAMTETTMIQISKRQFDSRLERSDPLIVAMLRILAETVRKAYKS